MGNTASVTAVPGATYTWTIENGDIIGPTDEYSITWTAAEYDLGSTIIHVTVTYC